MERLFKRQSSPVAPLGRPLWLKLYAALVFCQHNLRTRRQLAGLDSRQLADAGITELQREAELAKPFWR